MNFWNLVSSDSASDSSRLSTWTAASIASSLSIIECHGILLTLLFCKQKHIRGLIKFCKPHHLEISPPFLWKSDFNPRTPTCLPRKKFTTSRGKVWHPRKKFRYMYAKTIGVQLSFYTYYISPIEIKLLSAKITYIKSHSTQFGTAYQSCYSFVHLTPIT